MNGRCRFCGCTLYSPCPGACGWANSQQTVCTSCIDIDRAWSKQRTRRPNMVRAFFRGFTAATHDERAVDTAANNPYTGRGTARYWDDGFLAGMAWLRTSGVTR